jgi:transcriptional antiterminator RfaH
MLLTQHRLSYFCAAPARIHPRIATTLRDVHWYCIHTRPTKESQVADYCTTTLGVETYYPKLRQHRTIRRKRCLVTRPLFPRYLFARFDLQTNYRMVRYSPDVLDLVHIGEKPAVVADAIIASLREWSGAEQDVITMPSEFRAGDPVEVADGPLRGLSAVVLRVTEDRDRVAILLSMLHTEHLATISRSQLRRLE